LKFGQQMLGLAFSVIMKARQDLHTGRGLRPCLDDECLTSGKRVHWCVSVTQTLCCYHTDLPSGGWCAKPYLLNWRLHCSNNGIVRFNHRQLVFICMQVFLKFLWMYHKMCIL